MTLSELRKEAVRALGSDVEFVVENTTGPNRPWVAPAWIDDGAEVAVWHPKRTTAMRALYAALREMGGTNG